MKINLEEGESNAIAKLMAVGGTGVEAIKKLFALAEAELVDVRNIDPKGNMGLQTLAAQKSLDALQEIMWQMFPDQRVTRTGGTPTTGGPRRYQ